MNPSFHPELRSSAASILAIALGFGSLSAQEKEASEVGESFPSLTTVQRPQAAAVKTTFDVLQSVRRSIVHVYWKTEGQSHDRTPGFAAQDGIFVTVRQNAKIAEKVLVDTANGRQESTVAMIDPATGLVLIDGGESAIPAVPALPCGTSREFFISSTIFALQLNHEGHPNQAIQGVVIGRDRTVDGKPMPMAYMRLQIPGAKAFGGLPVLNERGEVVAVDLGTRLDDDGEEFHALPVEAASKLITDLEDFGKRENAWLGVTFNTGTTTAKVVSVRPDSPGAQANLLPGDVVIYFAGARIDTLDDLADTCYTLTPGRAAEIHVLRGVDRVQGRLTPVSVSKKPRIQDSGDAKP